MKQVMVREKMLHGNNNRLRPADVLSQTGDLLTVRIAGQKRTLTVRASDIIPMTKMTGGQAVTNLNRPIPLIHRPVAANHSLASTMNK